MFSFAASIPAVARSAFGVGVDTPSTLINRSFPRGQDSRSLTGESTRSTRSVLDPVSTTNLLAALDTGSLAP